MMTIHVALAAVALLTMSPTLAIAKDKPAPQECFWASQADSFAAPDDHTVNVRVNARGIYQFKLLGSCPDIDWNQHIALVSRETNICTGMDAEIISQSQTGPLRCTVTDMRKLTPAEIAALPRRARP